MKCQYKIDDTIGPEAKVPIYHGNSVFLKYLTSCGKFLYFRVRLSILPGLGATDAEARSSGAGFHSGAFGPLLVASRYRFFCFS